MRPRAALLLAMVCAGARLALFAIEAPWQPAAAARLVAQGDPHGYHQLAITLLTRHRFAFRPADPPEALRTPLYPLFVASAYGVVPHGVWLVLLAQIALDV